MRDFAERIKQYGVVERQPLLEGRNMIMILAPRDKDKDERAPTSAR